MRRKSETVLEVVVTAWGFYHACLAEFCVQEGAETTIYVNSQVGDRGNNCHAAEVALAEMEI